MPANAPCRCDECKRWRKAEDERYRRHRARQAQARQLEELRAEWPELGARERVRMRRESPELVRRIEAEAG